jgi:tRNA pseudouridine55 synthase
VRHVHLPPLMMTTSLPNSGTQDPFEGILLIDKPRGCTSFSLVQILRKRLGVKKIGHAGTLDPFATGVMVMLIGRRYTRLSDHFLTHDKEYVAQLFLGKTTDTYDCEGTLIGKSTHIPTLLDIQQTVEKFQGEIEQIPPMYSAKKIGGKKLYELARQGREVERAPVKIKLQTTFIRYEYPFLELRVSCSKGTYVRSIAFDMGVMLGCGAHLTNLTRTRSGKFKLEDCLSEEELRSPICNLQDRFIFA